MTTNDRIVFVNRRSMVTLGLVTLVLLAVLQPNRSLLIDMLAEAEDPTIALAFLQVLRDDDEPSLKLDLLTAKQHLKLADFVAAERALTPIDRFVGSTWQREAFASYASALLQQTAATQLTEDQRQGAKQRLAMFLTQQQGQLQGSDLERYSDYAVQTGAADIAYRLQLKNPNAAPQQLLQLALQAGAVGAAFEHAQQVYQRQQTADNLLQAVGLAQQLGTEQSYLEGLAMIREHDLSHECPTACLQRLVNYSQAVGANQLAFNLAKQKALRTDAVADLLQASDLAAAVGELAQASRWLALVVARTDNSAQQKQLVNYYLWQGDTAAALTLMQKSLSADSSTDSLRVGVHIARAESSIGALSDFLFWLALQNQLSLAELDEWVNASDRVLGAGLTAERLQTLLAGNTLTDAEKRHWAFSQLARFYNSSGNQEQTVAMWNSDLAGTSYADLRYFIQAHVDLGQPFAAVDIIENQLDLSSLSIEQLMDLQVLANYTGAIEVLKQLQVAQLTQDGFGLDPYLLVATHSANDLNDRTVLWAYYQHTGSLVVLAALLDGAIATHAQAELALLQQALLALSEQDSSTVLNLRLRLAFYQGETTLAKQLLQQLLAQDPQSLRYQIDAIWLAISLQDKGWLERLYWPLIERSRRHPELYQVLAYAAQQLELFHHALTWYQRLADANAASAADYLSWAQLLQQQGQAERAQLLRWQVLTQLVEALRQLPDGDISYRSLLHEFVAGDYADAELTAALARQTDGATVSSLLQSQGRNSLQRIHYWLALGQLARTDVNETVQLALALAQQDHGRVQALVQADNGLTAFERASALAEIGEQAQAWALGERALKPGQMPNQIAPLQRFLANLHRRRSHGVRVSYGANPGWNSAMPDISYYVPLDNLPLNSAENWHWLTESQLQITWQQNDVTYDDETNAPLADYKSQQLALQLRHPQGYYQLSLKERFDKLTVGHALDYRLRDKGRVNYRLLADWDSPATQGEYLNLFATQRRLGGEITWQATGRNTLTAAGHWWRYQTDAGEHIATSQQVQLRATETMVRTPNWQAYLQYDYHRNDLSAEPLDELFAHNKSTRLLNAGEFLQEKYHRIAVGQLLQHGAIGEPGPEVKVMRYFVDTSVGYNLVAKQIEVGASLGAGIRVLGGDELFIQANWQTGDVTGQDSLSFKIGYFFDF